MFGAELGELEGPVFEAILGQKDTKTGTLFGAELGELEGPVLEVLLGASQSMATSSGRSDTRYRRRSC